MSVYVCVCTRAAAREQSSNRVPTCGDICACENRMRVHLLDQLFTVGLGPGCPWKNLVKFSETVCFTPFRLMPCVKRWLQRQITLTHWTETRWTKAMTSQVLRCTWPPRLGSVVIQIVLRLGVLGKRQGSVSCGYLFTRRNISDIN